MAEVTALFVSPDARGTGLGASLLVKASSEARSRGLLPVVQVLDNSRAAMAMYQRMGWQLVGKAVAPWARSNSDTRFLHFYVLPA
jgi:GNAT superfamily N-acetyltransferase